MGRKRSKNLNCPPRMRPRARGRKVHYYYDAGGTPRKEIPLGTDFALALKKWAELEIANVGDVPRIITIGYVVEIYQKSVIPRKAPRTQRDNLTQLIKLLEFFNNPPVAIDEIEPMHIKQYLKWRTKDGRESLVRANREKSLFSHIWNFARGEGYTNKANPCIGIKGFSEPGRDIYVEDEVYNAIWDAADGVVRTAMDLAHMTGQRPSDILKISEEDIRNGVLRIEQGKTGKVLRIALEESTGEPNALGNLIWQIIAQKRGLHVYSHHLVCNESGQPITLGAITQRLTRIKRRAARNRPHLAKEINRVQFRDMRPKSGTDKVSETGNIRSAQALLGHGDPSMTEHYVRQRKADLVAPARPVKR